MIGRLHGTLVEKTPPAIIVDVAGVGYELDVPMSTFYNLPPLGERVALLTHLVIREDAHQLFGFASGPERHAFRELIKISGIGARTALSLLSGLSVDELAQAIVLQDAGLLTRVPGIGKKTAERLLLELKGKLGSAPGAGSSAGAGLGSAAADSATSLDIVRALLALGYSEREAGAAVRALPPGAAVADGIRAALKSLAKLG